MLRCSKEKGVRMFEHGKSLSSPESASLAGYQAYREELEQRLRIAEYTLTAGLYLLSDRHAVNDKLNEANRPDLALAEPAAMMVVTQPHEVLDRCNNFAPSFRFYTGRRVTREVDVFDRPIRQLIPITQQELLNLRGLPKFSDHAEMAAARQSGLYPGLDIMNHSTRTAFTRMLNLFPQFTTSVVLGMSALENQSKYTRFEAELYVSYQLMARLVDTSDRYVVKEDGTVDDFYLCS